jgi:hypothetical protein
VHDGGRDLPNICSLITHTQDLESLLHFASRVTRRTQQQQQHNSPRFNKFQRKENFFENEKDRRKETKDREEEKKEKKYLKEEKPA